MKEQHELITSDLFTEWSQSDRGESMARGHNELLDPLFEKWKFSAHSNLLDVGCGVGAALSRANKLGAKGLAGIDLSAGMIKEAEKNLPKAAQLSVGSVLELPWKTNSFTHVVSVEALYYVQNPVLALKEIIRVLQSHGEFAMIIEFYGENSGTHDWASNLPMKLCLWSEKEWKEAFMEAGFEDVITSRVVRKSIKTEEEFKPSAYYPEYSLYLDYMREGALWVNGTKS